MLSLYANYDSDTVDPVTNVQRGGIKTNSNYISQPQKLTSETGLAIFLTANDIATLKFDIIVEFTNIIQEPYDFSNTYNYNEQLKVIGEILIPKQAQYFRIKIINYEFTLTNLKVNTFLISNLYNLNIHLNPISNKNFITMLNNITSIAANTIYSTYITWTRGQYGSNSVLVYDDSSTSITDSISIYTKDISGNPVFLGIFYPIVVQSKRRWTLNINLMPFSQLSIGNNSSSAISNVNCVIYSA